MTWAHTEVLSRSAVLNYGASLIGSYRPGYPTGIPTWDGACEETGGEGLGHWWYTVIGGASNAGKTRLLQHLLRQGVEHGRIVGLITMEVPTKALQRMWYAAVTSFHYRDFLPLNWEQDGVEKTKRLADEVGAYADGRGKLVVAEHDGAPSLEEIVSMAQSLRDAGCDAIGFDHLQLIQASEGEITDRATAISEALRRFAHRTETLVFALSQLKRTAAEQRNRRPIAQDCWGGTSIESNANQVVLIDHSFQVRDEDNAHLMRTNLYLDKNREGVNRLLVPVEVNFATGVWREAMPDELHLWSTD